jgi:hypothetical protein
LEYGIAQTLCGVNTLVLGTYGQHLLFYPLANMLARMSVTSTKDERLAVACSTPRLPRSLGTFPLPAAAFQMCARDITSDGLRELLVTSQRGLHVLQVRQPSVSPMHRIPQSASEQLKRKKTPGARGHRFPWRMQRARSWQGSGSSLERPRPRKCKTCRPLRPPRRVH